MDVPALFEAASDDDAIPQARALLDGPYIQLWQANRFVTGLRKPVKSVMPQLPVNAA